jgi:hypothetical protein
MSEPEGLKAPRRRGEQGMGGGRAAQARHLACAAGAGDEKGGRAG